MELFNQNWVEAFARNHEIPIEWAEKGVRKEEYVLRWLRPMVRARSPLPESAPTFRCAVPKYPTRRRMNDQGRRHHR